MRISNRTFSTFNIKSTLMGLGIAIGVGAFVFVGVSPTSENLDSKIAARVANETITMRQLSQVADSYSRQSGEIPDEKKQQANIQNALNQLINEKLFVAEANRYGWIPTDLEVAQWIRSIPLFQDEKTKQFSMTAYQKFMKTGQMSELELYQRGKDALSRQAMAYLLELSAHTPKQLLEIKQAIDETKFHLSYVEIKPNEIELQTAVKKAAEEFLSAENNVSFLQQKYDQNSSEYNRAAQVQADSILIAFEGAQRATGEALKRTEEEAKRLAESIHGRLQRGEKFSVLAAQTNDDLEAKNVAGKGRWMDAKTTDPVTFEQLASIQEKQKLSQVFRTDFGYRILYWMNYRPAFNRSFESVKRELAEQEVLMQTRLKMTSELEKDYLELVKAGDRAGLDALFTSRGLAWRKLESPFSARNPYLAEIGLADSLISDVFSLKKPDDMVKRIVDLNSRKFIIKLNYRTEAPPTDERSLKTMKLMSQYQASERTNSAVQQKLFDIYTREKRIQRNTALLR